MRTTCLFLLAAMALNGCSRWQVQQVTPQQLISDRSPRSVRIRQHSGPLVVLREPFLRGDTILGRSGRSERAVSLIDVHEVSIRRTDPVKTTGLVVLIVAPIALFVGAMVTMANAWN